MRALIALFAVIFMIAAAPVTAAECPAWLDHDLRSAVDRVVAGQ